MYLTKLQPPRLTLFPYTTLFRSGQAIPKGKNMDLIVQKAVEIGAAEIAPIISDRTIVQVDSESAGQKQSKWQQIRSEEHTSELQSRQYLVCRLLLEKKNINRKY